ncbi:MAG: hypothetical protein M9953_10190 [Thermomicrobiales bacterium]|nr:hypothetical protein [Thermomicrobiales bacterium]MCO5225699.1 hypothetical protein [Thermomicrobiales bacterium]MCO5227950.1 hypothetical protein [Thermomicrobiales bacterium]
MIPDPIKIPPQENETDNVLTEDQPTPKLADPVDLEPTAPTRSIDSTLAMGVAIGVALGAALGTVWDNIALGVGIGIAVGVILAWIYPHIGRSVLTDEGQPSPRASTLHSYRDTRRRVRSRCW